MAFKIERRSRLICGDPDCSCKDISNFNDHWVDQTNQEGEERHGQDCPQALFSFFMSFEIWEERGGGIIAQCNL